MYINKLVKIQNFLPIQLISKGTPDRGYRGDFFVLAWHFKVYLLHL